VNREELHSLGDNPLLASVLAEFMSWYRWVFFIEQIPPEQLHLVYISPPCEQYIVGGACLGTTLVRERAKSCWEYDRGA